MRVKFAVLGCGHIGKRHASMIMRNPEAELIALCDILPQAQLGLEAFEVPFFNSIEALLESELEFEVLCICTPNNLHAPQAIKGLEAQKHVVIEKPMGLNKAICEQVIHQSLNVSKYVFCVMQNRYSPPSIWLKEIMDAQRLGSIHMVQINCYWNRDDRYYFKNGKAHPWKGSLEQDGGPLFTQFSHFVDIMYWLFGDICDIKASFSNFTHAHSTAFEDSGAISFKFLNGGLGTINYSTAIWDKNMESSITISGSKGSIKVGGQYMNEVEYCHIQDYEMPELPASNPANDYGLYKGSAANHVYIIENVVDVIKARKRITTNALEGLKVVDIIERIYALRNLKAI